MLVKKAEFYKGIVKGDESWPAHIPQIVFYGRSNAGKSSSINAIVNRNGLAKSSATPGKTRQVNFFNINDKLYFVDLPGYGYAKVSRQQKDAIQDLIFWFMTETSAKSRTHVIVLDAKVGLTELDLQIVEALEPTGEKIIILLNKSDKLRQNDLAKAIKKANSELSADVSLLPFSARTKKGVIEFWKLLS